ncbi:MAG: serine/threonine protein kinase, partial [Betaproteobacteria bacterium]|nr:serine/threonine protein kinase [Betaproteobacteria bacterium]
MARLYAVCPQPSASGPPASEVQAPAELLMKVPRMSVRDGSETIVSFEVESTILPRLKGKHVPRLYGSGSLEQVPYLLMEHLPGQTLVHWLLELQRSGSSAPLDEIVRIGTGV